MRWRWLSLSVALCVLLAPRSDAQFRSFGGNPNVDPNQVFDFLAQGRPFFLISETRALREPLMLYAREKGIAGDQMNREQFLAFLRAASNLAPASTSDQFNQVADVEFKRRDRNGDGTLNKDEFNDSLRNNLAAYDKNGDGLVNFEEYKTYYFDRMTQKGPFAPTTPRPPQPQAGPEVKPTRYPVIILIQEDLDARPTVYRAGKLPKNLPKWFGELDADVDGQVALYEWRKGGMKLDEFAEWDRSEDGFITPEECLRHLAQLALEPARPTNPTMARTPPPAGGGRPFGGKDFKRRN